MSRRLPPSSSRKTANDDVPGCRLAVAVRQTHVRARTISHARTPGTIPSSRCQTTRRDRCFDPANKCSHGRDMPSRLYHRSSQGAKVGGARRDRTDDLMLAKHALSQLSYGPYASGKLNRRSQSERRLVGLGRFELPTSRLSSARSNPTELQARF